jgi:hypothetical protein
MGNEESRGAHPDHHLGQSFEALPAKSRDQQKLNEGVQFRLPGFSDGAPRRCTHTPV